MCWIHREKEVDPLFSAALSTSVSPTGQRVADLGSFIAASGVQGSEVLDTRTERESKQISLAFRFYICITV